jgi:uncharacterized protein
MGSRVSAIFAGGGGFLFTWRTMLHQFLATFAELAPWLLLGAIVAGGLHALLPPQFLRRNLRGRFAVLKAVAMGVPLPLCSCGVIPVGLSLKKQGADDGATVGFLISTPQTGVDSILVSASLLGWPFALFKVVAALVTGAVGGLLAGRGESVDALAETSAEGNANTPRRGFHEAWQHGLEMIRSVYGWILVGVLVSSLISVAVPEDSLAAMGQAGGLPGMLVALVVSVPLYVCATASVPIAAALVAAGLPPGAALVFLMAGPATNVATIGAVYRTLGARSLAVYLGTIIVGSLAAGLAFDQVLSIEPLSAVGHDHSSAWWQVASSILLGILFLKFLVEDLRHRLRKQTTTESDAPETVVTVDGMTCEGCAAKLERGLASMPDIDSARVSYAAGTAAVHSQLSNAELASRVAECGFTAVAD